MATQQPFGNKVDPITVYMEGGNGSVNSAVTIANGADVALGSTTDNAVGDANGTLIAHARYLAALGGATNGTAVVTDANGTLQQYLRGLVALSVSGITILNMPSKSLLSDNAANPNAALLGSAMQGWQGSGWDRIRVANTQADVNGTAVTTTGNSVWAGTASKKTRLMGGSISVNAASSIAFCDGNAAGTVLFRTPLLGVNSAYSFLVNGGQGSLSGTNANNIVAVASANGAMTGTLYGTLE